MILSENLFNQLQPLIHMKSIAFDENLSKHTYPKIGGKADFFITPNNYFELQKIVQFFRSEKLPITIIGNGSNLIIRDGGIRGAVISLNKINHIFIDQENLICGGGALLIKASRKATTHHLKGLEFACGIPGTIGGAVYMNAGAYGGEIKDVLESVLVLDRYNRLQVRKNDELNLSYRHSNIGDNEDIILEAVFKLKHGKYEEIKALVDKLTKLRKKNQPLEYPSCGSVFKRPVGHYAGKLIQDSNLQGARIGGAEVSKKHAGFIVNVDHATASDYISLIELIQKTVKEKFNVELETEVKIIGEDLDTNE